MLRNLPDERCPEVANLLGTPRRPNLGRKTRLEKVPLPSESQPVHGEAPCLKIDIESLKTISGFAVGAGIETREQQRVLTLDRDSFFEPLIIALGRYSTRLGFGDWRSSPTTYIVFLANLEGNPVIDGIPQAPLTETGSNNNEMPHEHGYGACRPQVDAHLYHRPGKSQ